MISDYKENRLCCSIYDRRPVLNRFRPAINNITNIAAMHKHLQRSKVVSAYTSIVNRFPIAVAISDHHSAKILRRSPSFAIARNGGKILYLSAIDAKRVRGKIVGAVYLINVSSDFLLVVGVPVTRKFRIFNEGTPSSEDLDIYTDL